MASCIKAQVFYNVGVLGYSDSVTHFRQFLMPSHGSLILYIHKNLMWWGRGWDLPFCKQLLNSKETNVKVNETCFPALTILLGRQDQGVLHLKWLRAQTGSSGCCETSPVGVSSSVARVWDTGAWVWRASLQWLRRTQIFIFPIES